MAKNLCSGIIAATDASCPTKNILLHSSPGLLSQKKIQNMSRLQRLIRLNKATPKEISKLSHLETEAKKIIEKHQTNFWDKINKLDTSDTKGFHDNLRNILGKKSSQESISLLGDGKFKSTADHFSKYFESILNDNSKANYSRKCKQVCKNKAEKWFISEADILRAISQTNDKLSAGTDGTVYPMFKISPRAITAPLATLAQDMLDYCHFPKYFKVAKAIVLHKKNSRDDPGNYRVIALLNMLSKIIESMIAKKILEHLNKYDILYDGQNGYRKFRSTDDLCIELLHFVLSAKGDKIKFGIIFYDYRKAFDFLNIDRLLIKLKSMGFTKGQRDFLESYLRDRQFLFFVNGSFSSSPCNLNSGVPQKRVRIYVFNDYD